MPHFNEVLYHAGGIPGTAPVTGGNIFWADSGAALAADTVVNGKTRDRPFATADYAIGRCTANNGDVIFVCEGHSETKSVTGSFLAADKAGISIIGLGSGADRPTFTFSHTGAAMTISAASVTFKNLLFVAGIDVVTAPLTISAADWALIDIEWRDAQDVEFVRCLITTAAADRGKIIRPYHDGYTGGDESINFARLVGVNGLLIQDVQFHGNYSVAIIEFHTTLSTKVDILGGVFNDTGTTDISDNVLDTVGSSTWWVDAFDLSAGDHFSGGSGGAVTVTDLSAIATTIDNVSAGVSTVDSKIVSSQALASPAVKAVSEGVSTVDSKIVSAQALASPAVKAVSEGVSTVDSKIVSAQALASPAVKAVSEGVSTVDSKVVSAQVLQSGGVSTLDSKVVSAQVLQSGGVSTVDSKIVSSQALASPAVKAVSEGVSTVDSKIVSTQALGSSAISTVQANLVPVAGAYMPGWGTLVTKVSDMASDPDALFDIVGKVMITLMIGEVTTAIPSACTINIELASGEALAATTTIDNDPLYTMYLVTGDTGAILNGTDAPVTYVAQGSGTPLSPLIIGRAGDTAEIRHNLDAAEASGAITWNLWYYPLEASAAITAAA